MKKFTKIVATVSDKRCDVGFINDLFVNGMNVVRMNSAHLSLDGFTKIVNNVRKVSERIGILIDTKGPEIRTTNNDFPDRDTPIAISAGDKIRFVGNPDILSSHECIALSYAGIADDVRPGDHLLIDDGELDFVIDSIEERTISPPPSTAARSAHARASTYPAYRSSSPPSPRATSPTSAMPLTSASTS